MKIKNRIISIAIIIITLVNIAGVSKASVLDGTSMIVAGWYGDIPYSYNDEEQKAVRRSCDNTPVYTLKKNNAGGYFYTTDVEIYPNIKVKNIIKNGYGCKTYKELNCLTMEEAYLATQEAIYIELEGRNIEDYVITGTQGDRILSATKQILEAASKEKEDIEIILKDEYLKEYANDTNYKYKEMQIKIENVNNIKLEILESNDCKIIDATGNEKSDFINEETFFLLVPKNIDQEVSVKVSYEKDGIVIYGCKNEGEEDNLYLVTLEGIESFEQEEKVNVLGNSKIEITNKDKETKTAIAGNKYAIIKEDGTVIKDNLITDENGKVSTTLDNGKYYLKQEETIEEYTLNKALIEINIENVEPVSINIESTKALTEENTTVVKEINIVDDSKNIVENNVTEVSNVTTTNINKEIINETNKKYLNNVNNFINTINRTNVTNLKKENTFTNEIQEEFVKNETVQGENNNSTMTRTDYINYIDMIMLDSAKVPILPVASK